MRNQLTWPVLKLLKHFVVTLDISFSVDNVIYISVVAVILSLCDFVRMSGLLGDVARHHTLLNVAEEHRLANSFISAT